MHRLTYNLLLVLIGVSHYQGHASLNLVLVLIGVSVFARRGF